MKTLFLTADLGGNVPPTLAAAEALVRRGAEVTIAGLKPERTALPQLPFPAAALIAEQRVDLVVVDCMVPAVIRGAVSG